MGSRSVVTDQHIRNAHRSGHRSLAVSPEAIVTPLARDTARQLGVDLVLSQIITDSGQSHSPGAMSRVVAIGSDHGGFDLKKLLIPFVVDLGWTIRDMGTDSTRSCDYPDFAYSVARVVGTGDAFAGIMIDGAGIGSAIVCNKVPGVRAACAYNEFTAWNARAHNDCNVLTLGSRVLGIELCKGIVRTFLATDFEGGRHAGRVEKIVDIEDRFTGPA